MSKTASHRHAGRRRGAAPARRPVAAAESPARRTSAAAPYVWAAARISLGWIFLWAFLDKFFGLGHETPSAGAVIHGGSPTEGFLANAVGPFDGICHGMAGSAVVDVLFMAGLAGIGVALMAGVALKPAAAAGALMMVLMWSASLPPANNPFMDDHIVYALVMVGLALSRAGDVLGLGRAWARLSLVRRYGWLR